MGTAAAITASTLVALGLATPEGASTGAAARPAVVCPKLRPTVELAFGLWGGPGTLLLQREQFAAAGSWGSAQAGGYTIFGSATPRKAYTDRVCAWTRDENIGPSTLSPAYRYRHVGANAYFVSSDGDRLIGELLHQRTVSALHLRGPSGVSFSCRTSGRVTVRLQDVFEGGRSVGTTLRVSDPSRLLGIAELRRSGRSYFRVATSCDAL